MKVVKICKKHGRLTLPHAYLSKEYKGNLYYHCKMCKDAYNKKFKKDNPDLKNLYAQRSYARNRGKILKDVVKWREINRERRNRHRMALYYLKKGNPEPMKLYKQKYGKNNG